MKDILERAKAWEEKVNILLKETMEKEGFTDLLPLKPADDQVRGVYQPAKNIMTVKRKTTKAIYIFDLGDCRIW